MNKLTWTLQHLPTEGKRLGGGLALQLHHWRELAVLACSRIDQPPSDIEMRTVAEAVVEAFRPAVIWRGQVFVVEDKGHSHHIWRLYWPSGAFEQVYSAPAVQERLMPLDNSQLPF